MSKIENVAAAVKAIKHTSSNWRDFFKQYYEHIEVVYKEVWEARQRLVNGENVIPPQHRPVVKGKNGVPDVMRSGLK